jgi:hypothetical protein
MVVLAADGESASISRRGGKGRRLRGWGAEVSLGGGHGSEGGPRVTVGMANPRGGTR